jgi:hypothetical protein
MRDRRKSPSTKRTPATPNAIEMARLPATTVFPSPTPVLVMNQTPDAGAITRQQQSRPNTSKRFRKSEGNRVPCRALDTSVAAPGHSRSDAQA